MTMKDYELIASLLHSEFRKFGVIDEYNEREAYGFSTACGAIAEAFARDNPRFNADKFIKAVTG